MKEKSDIIKNRESWLKTTVIVFFSLVIGIPLFWNLITGKITFDFGDLNFEALLTVIISFFAIYLSVLFYFKATESSNHFYNNSYAFTKDISETLRGIEAGFGEKLKNIDKGYEDFRKSFENYITPTDKLEIKKEVEEEKKKMKEIISEKDNLISELEVKSNLSKQELNKYLKQIKTKELELREKNEQINVIKHSLMNDNEININKDQYYRLRKYILTKFLPEINKDILSSSIQLRNSFRNLSVTFNKSFMIEMERAGLTNNKGDLIKSGIDFIRQIASE
ncbi:MAG: hypothetical protein ACSHXA_17640 [Polaribacter sp.]|uniref:hypothetical protein n=1 Tax=Polaribacter sp. TaxID=1920175 RepID=UPI003EF3F0AC